MDTEIRGIVRSPATMQTAKGLVSAGFGKSVRYSASKVKKWWNGDVGNDGTGKSISSKDKDSKQ
jgi:translocator assembly and maintenance protein 41